MLEEQDLKDNQLNRLINVIQWSSENKELWGTICGFDECYTTIDTMRALITECKHKGFMELYYLLLSKMGEVMGLNLFSAQFIEFIKNTMDKEMDFETVEKSTA